MGPPGSGKGTQGVHIAEELRIPRISTGEALRDEVASQTSLGKELEDKMNKGKLISNEIVLGLLEKKISTRSCQNGFILDGFPRNVVQADSLKEILNGLAMSFKIMVIDIAVSDQAVIDRITNRYYCTKCKMNYNKLYKNPLHQDICDGCGAKNTFAVRDDDTKEIVQNRLIEYHKETSPLISYYKKQGILYSVQGNKNINEVTAEIKSILKKY